MYRKQFDFLFFIFLDAMSRKTLALSPEDQLFYSLFRVSLPFLFRKIAMTKFFSLALPLFSLFALSTLFTSLLLILLYSSINLHLLSPLSSTLRGVIFLANWLCDIFNPCTFHFASILVPRKYSWNDQNLDQHSALEKEYSMWHFKEEILSTIKEFLAFSAPGLWSYKFLHQNLIQGKAESWGE